MLRLVLLLLLLLASVWLGVQLKVDPGYLLIVYKTWTIEMPLWFAVITFIVASLLLYSGISLIHRCDYLLQNIRGHFIQWRLKQLQQRTHKGMIALAEGRWQTAEKELTRAAKTSKTPLLHYLGAARAAQGQNAYDRRDDYLRLAHAASPDAEIAVGMVQAQLQLSHQQVEQGLATLQNLQNLAPKHNQVLKLLQRLYLDLNDWQSLINLYPTLCKRKVLTPTELQELGRIIYQEVLNNAAKNTDGVTHLQQTWDKIPKDLKRDVYLIGTYARCLLDKHGDVEAETLLHHALKKSWDAELIRLYGLARGPNPHKQLAAAEAWLKNHTTDANLLLTLGRLCVRNQLWGKARNYFESSIKFVPNPIAYRELAMLLEQLGEKALADNYYKQGLLLATA